MKVGHGCSQPVVTDRHDPVAVLHSAHGDGHPQTRSTTGDVGRDDGAADDREPSVVMRGRIKLELSGSTISLKPDASRSTPKRWTPWPGARHLLPTADDWLLRGLGF